jgi:hypothetical protein
MELSEHEQRMNQFQEHEQSCSNVDRGTLTRTFQHTVVTGIQYGQWQEYGRGTGVRTELHEFGLKR